ncbi:MAG: DUF1080 domain-containing protein, partial [Akkermansiaceae bacterium]
MMLSLVSVKAAEVGLGVKPVEGAEVIFDGSREMLDSTATARQGPRVASAMPFKWPMGEATVAQG